MTTTLRARFDGKVFVPLEEVDIPIGEVLTLHRDGNNAAIVSTPVPGTPADKTGLMRLAEKLASYPTADLPADYSAQHDHYLYGTEKRDDA